MKIKMKVKYLEDVQTGVSKSSGDEWKLQGIVLECIDTEGTQRVRATAFGKMVDELVKFQVRQGVEINCDLWFSTTQARSGFVYNEVRLVGFEPIREGGAQ